MKLITKSFSALFRRPSIIIFLGIIFAGVAFLLNGISDIATTLGGWSDDAAAIGDKNASDSIFNTIIYVYTAVFNLLSTADVIIKVVIGLVVVFVLGSGITSLVFSGYYNTVYHSLDKKKRVKNSFLLGMQKYFLKVWGINILLSAVTTVIVILTVLATVPAIVYLNAGISGNTQYLLIGIVFAALTIFVLFFTFMYFLIYITMWFPAIFANEKRPVKASKELVNANFWKIFARYFIVVFAYIALLAVCWLISSVSGIGLIGIVLSWIVNTLFFGFITVYIFAIYRFISVRSLA